MQHHYISNILLYSIPILLFSIYVLNFQYIGAQSLHNAYFGEGTGPILITYVYCSLPKLSLLNCNINYYYYYQNDHNHNNDAGVRCQRELKDILKYNKYCVIHFSFL